MNKISMFIRPSILPFFLPSKEGGVETGSHYIALTGLEL